MGLADLATDQKHYDQPVEIAGTTAAHTIQAVHPSASTHFDTERGLASRNLLETNRAAALDEWRHLGTA